MCSITNYVCLTNFFTFSLFFSPSLSLFIFSLLSPSSPLIHGPSPLSLSHSLSSISLFPLILYLSLPFHSPLTRPPPSFSPLSVTQFISSHSLSLPLFISLSFLFPHFSLPFLLRPFSSFSFSLSLTLSRHPSFYIFIILFTLFLFYLSHFNLYIFI